MIKKVLIAGDNHGDILGEAVQAELKNLKIESEILARKEKDSYVEVCTKAINEFKKDKTIDGLVLICGTGIGASMVANRFKDVRAVLVKDKQTAYFARRHENANCLCLAGGYTDGKMEVKPTQNLKAILAAFFKTEFEGGRHAKRTSELAKIGD